MTTKMKNKQFLLVLLVILLALVFVLPAFGITLRQGSSGQAVIDVQVKLKQWGYYTGIVDGIFGSKTTAAVKYFQRKNGLTPDGIVGRATFAALGLNQYVSTAGTSSSASNSDQVNLLAKAIFAEAEGEPYIGQVAVGAVLLNRVEDSNFPNTLSGVIYQSNALESVSNGRFYSYNNQATIIKAAKDALAGWDPTYGCLYFWNPAKVPASSWIWTRQIVVTYGQHVFGK